MEMVFAKIYLTKKVLVAKVKLIIKDLTIICEIEFVKWNWILSIFTKILKMPNDCITYQNSGYFTQLIVDYLEEKESLQPLYNRFPKIENFKSKIEEKNKNYLSAEERLLMLIKLKIKTILDIRNLNEFWGCIFFALMLGWTEINKNRKC